MSAVERLQAAIDRLERLKAESTPKPWHYWTDDLTDEVDLWHDQEVRSHVATLGPVGKVRVYQDAELIVTLHRTIDAQLAILRAAVVWFEKAAVEWSSETWIKHPELAGAVQSVLQQELVLADAILGGEA